MQGACEKIKEWIKSKVKEAGAEGAVIGLSGGVDSSVAAVLAKQALGDRLLGLLLPCGTAGDGAEKAGNIAGKFGIRTREIDLTGTLGLLLKGLPQADRKTVGNLKARLRMVILYYFANMENLLVVGTTNKSEMKIGYFTKYGDSAADIEPLGDLYKTDVYRMARFLGIPAEIIKAEPSAGLWEGQTDFSEMGFDYEDVDQVLRSMEEGSPKEAAGDVKKKIMEMMERNEHKRKPPEVCEMGGVMDRPE